MFEFLLVIQMIIFLVSGYLLIKGSDYFIKGAENIGLLMKISPFVVGVFILGFGTSLPEIVSGVFAILQGEVALPASVAVGSNIANLLLLLGIFVVLTGGIKLTTRLAEIQLPLMASALLLFGLVVYDAKVVLVEGLFLLAAALVYVVYSLSDENRIATPNEDYEVEDKRFKHLFKDLASTVGGVFAVFIGAYFLVDSTTVIAHSLGISSELIGLTLIAIGSSLPELAVSLRAVSKGSIELAVGNLIGSTIINTTVILGVATLFGTAILSTQTYTFAFPVMIGVFIVIIVSGITDRISKWEGYFLLIAYVLFILKLVGLV